ncbi:MAG: helix-turn-helix domain-containing protein, partial [Prevotella sp.]|nr:helix-turn-helix domain-containing protein [Prevotella sp.]
VEDVCDNAALNRQDRLIIILLLQQGYKSKEVAQRMGVTPSAVSQRFKKLKEEVLVPYFRKNFDMDLHMPEVIDQQAMAFNERAERSMSCYAEAPMAMPAPMPMEDMDYSTENIMEKRTTPEFITELQPNEVFVFGSNLRGMHGGGAAYLAYRKFGAVMGQGVGLQGQSYAIPTMQGGVETISPYVDEFIAFAKAHPELTFLVTRIGCGIAGFTDGEIAPLFAEAHGVENIILPPRW